MTVDAPAKITVKEAIKQAGRNTSAGTSSAGKCKDCVKEKLAIFLALPGVGPAKAVAKLPQPSALLMQMLNIRPVTKEAAYFIRPLRPGYVYVFKEGAPEAEQWDAYVVGSDGMLQLEPVGNLSPDPSSISHPDEKACSRPEHNAFSPQFISIDPERYKKIWVAFSDSRWSSQVLDDYAKDTYKGNKLDRGRLKRMLPLDLATIKTGAEVKGVIKASEQALEANVAGFKADDISEIDNSRLRFSIPRRDGQAASVARRMAHASRETKSPGVIVMLHDTVGMLAELNWQRQRALAELGVYQSDPEVAWKKLSADAIAAVRERIRQRNKAELIQDKTGKPWSKDHDPKEVMNNKVPVRRWLYNDQLKNGSIPKDSVFEIQSRPDPKDPSADWGFIRMPTDSAAVTAAASDYASLEKQYDEGARKAFLVSHQQKIDDLNKLLDQWEKEWSAWVNVSVMPDGMPDLTTIVRLDHRGNDRQCAPHYIRVVGECVGMGPLSKDSLPWFKKTLGLPVTDPNQILLRAPYGNQDGLIKWAYETKQDKVYDAIKGILQAEDLKISKWVQLGLPIYANWAISAVGAAAMLLNKDGTLDKGVKDVVTRMVCTTLKLWDNIDIGFIRIVGAKLGDLHEGLLAAAFIKAANTMSIVGPAKNTVMKAAGGRLPAAVANKTINALLWTADKAEDIEKLLKYLASADIEPEKRAAVVIRAGEKNMQKAFALLQRPIPKGRTRDFVAGVVKRTDSIVGSSNILLSAGVIYIQWFQATDNLEQVMKYDGADRMNALLGLGDALCSIMGASAEMYEGVKRAQIISTKQKLSKELVKKVRFMANGLAGVASLFNMIQSFGAAGRRWNEGDKDAGRLHGFAGAAFFGAAAASFSMMGADAVFFGSLLGLGPAGWAVLFTVAAVGLTYAALTAEDTPAEIFVARNQFWHSKPRNRKEPLFVSWLDEANAFTALWHGVSVDLDWNGWRLGKDKVTMKIAISEPSPEHGWRYRLWATLTNNGMMEEFVMYSGAEKVENFPLGQREQEAKTILAGYSPTSYLIGGGAEFEAASRSDEKGQIVIEQRIWLNHTRFKQVRIKVEYFPDAGDMSRSTCLEARSTD